MDVLITGGNGLLGRHLVPALLVRGDRVRVLTLPSDEVSWLVERGVEIFAGDVRKPETLAAPLQGIDTIFHLADLMNVRLPMQDHVDVNVTGAENVCKAALAAHVRRVVHVSSWTVYGMVPGTTVTEDAPLNPLPDPYSQTKAAGDRAIRRMIEEKNLPAVIVRPGTFFGPHDRHTFERIADRLRAGKGIIVGSGDNALPFVYVTDVVTGLLLAADVDHAVGQKYNISTDQPLTQQEFLSIVAAEVQCRPPARHIPFNLLCGTGPAAERIWKLTRLGRQPPLTRLEACILGTDNRHSIDKARRQLGYYPHVSIREGIRLAAWWYCRRPLEERIVAGFDDTSRSRLQSVRRS